MAGLMGRFARFGVVGFVVTWAAATLTVTAATLDRDARPVTDTATAEASAADSAAETTPASDGDAGPTEGSSTPTTVPPPTAAPPTTAPPATGSEDSEESEETPDHLVVPTSTEAVRTEVLAEVATAASAVTAQPDFTG